MSDIIFLDPSAETPDDIVTLGQLCKQNMLKFLSCKVVDETLVPDSENTVLVSKNSNWLSEPDPVIYTLDDTGLRVLQHEGTDYSIDLAGGVVTFLNPPVTDSVEASYTFFPFSDTEITEMVKHSLTEICNLTYRDIDPDNIHSKYLPAICKRLYTNILKSLQLRAKDFYSISVAGRSINKASIVSQTDAIITQNENQLSPEIEALRFYNQTNRITPTVNFTKTINSDAEIV